jgi:hypothetical protein
VTECSSLNTGSTTTRDHAASGAGTRGPTAAEHARLTELAHAAARMLGDDTAGLLTVWLAGTFRPTAA